ncbi:hypothetical protein AKJ57_02580 [candidate division MSBL1 archaeon SCGC-AAA259A05]|uniref:Uncharacterized protein n=1 Tax=candidate division MSBL1 archaeon SCGC-AAA259A05 TaxID=1698259 RepID=A0A133UA58_9EURY|nr:hypothetical protein AKJ57_02580 [candidate division MSBL1 archaeon SCGC-AAA259A05]
MAVTDKLGGENAMISRSFTLVETETESKIFLNPWNDLLTDEDVPSNFFGDAQNEWEVQDKAWLGVPVDNAAARY